MRAEKTEPEKQNQSAEAQPATSQPAEQTSAQPNLPEGVAQYVALGGPLGGGLAAPPADTDVPGYDPDRAVRRTRQLVFEDAGRDRGRRQGQYQAISAAGGVCCSEIGASFC